MRNERRNTRGAPVYRELKMLCNAKGGTKFLSLKTAIKNMYIKNMCGAEIFPRRARLVQAYVPFN